MPDSVQKSHLALMDALMSLAAKETVGRVKMAAEAEQMGVGSPWENALLFWVNRVRPSRVWIHIFNIQIVKLYCFILTQIIMQVTAANYCGYWPFKK